MKEPFTVTEENLPEIATKIRETLLAMNTATSKVLFLEGDLGAGKTTFTKALAESFGVDKEEVHSPTFILKKEYKTNHPVIRKLIHVDAYRFDSPHEAKVLKLASDVEKGDAVLVIEWPSKLGGMIDEDMTISFEVIDDTRRELVVNFAQR